MSKSEISAEKTDNLASIHMIEQRTFDDAHEMTVQRDRDADVHALNFEDVANDDDAYLRKLAEPPAEPNGRWTRFVPLQYFLVGSALTSMLMAAGIWAGSTWETFNTLDAAVISVAVFSIALIAVLILQNSHLIAEYRASEVNRVYPHRVIAASRVLTNEAAEMENRLMSYSNVLTETTGQIHRDAGKLNEGFQTGAEELRLTLTQWDKARHEFSARFNVIKTHIDEARMSIETTVNRLPADTKKATEEIVNTFDSQMDALIGKLQSSMSTDLKFQDLSEKILGAERGIETLFAEFERNFVNRVNDIQPTVLAEISKAADRVTTQVSGVVSEMDRQLKNVSAEIQSNNDEFFKQIPEKVESFKVDSQNVIQQFSDAISSNSRNAIETITREKTEFEDQYKQSLISLKEYLADLSKDIKDASNQTEQNFDGFLEKFNFNFMGKLNFFSELIESKTHTFSDQMLDEIELLKKNFADLANTFSQVIESAMMSFDRRAEYTTLEFENHLSSMISKSLSNIATRLDIFEEQVTSRIGKMSGNVSSDPTLPGRRASTTNRYGTDYLNVLEQQMSDIHQALFDLKKGGNTPPRK